MNLFRRYNEVHGGLGGNGHEAESTTMCTRQSILVDIDMDAFKKTGG